MITGNYDTIRPPIEKHPHWDFVLLKHKYNSVHIDGWDRVIDIEDQDNMGMKYLSRKPKILPHRYLDYDYTIYHDANMQLLIDPEELYKKYGQYDVTVGKHPKTNCVYKEVRKVIRLKKDSSQNVNMLKDFLRRSGYPANNGMTSNGFLLRRNNDKVKRMMEEWWQMITKFSYRDQLSFMYVKENRPEINIKITEPFYKNRNIVKFNKHNA